MALKHLQLTVTKLHNAGENYFLCACMSFMCVYCFSWNIDCRKKWRFFRHDRTAGRLIYNTLSISPTLFFTFWCGAICYIFLTTPADFGVLAHWHFYHACLIFSFFGFHKASRFASFSWIQCFMGEFHAFFLTPLLYCFISTHRMFI